MFFVRVLARTTDEQLRSLAAGCWINPPVYRIPPILQGRRQLPRRLRRLPAQEIPPPPGITEPGRVVPPQQEAVVPSRSVASVGALYSSRALLAPRHGPCAGVASNRKEGGCRTTLFFSIRSRALSAVPLGEIVSGVGQGVGGVGVVRASACEHHLVFVKRLPCLSLAGEERAAEGRPTVGAVAFKNQLATL